ncbi:MAG: hypothetical protein JST42_11525 [Bacteroidetes bacterium]|nr:hypothetical protein [Bacteroidota bacterium]
MQHSFEERYDLRLDAFDSTTYRLLDTGQLLYYRSEGPGFLMPSLNAFLQARQEMPTDEPRHILAGLTPSRDSFMSIIPHAASRIASTLGIPREKLDSSFASLHLIDNAIHAQPIGLKMFENELFVPLIAYLGQCIIHEKGGRWNLQHDNTAKVWEPFVILPTGKAVNLFIDLYEDAQEDFKNFSIFTISQLRLESL